jgi:DNA-nicking Smr family endonuclease
MDFGEILKKWENGKSHSSKKSTLEAWLETNEVIDKDAKTQDEYAPSNPRSGERRRRLLNAKPDDILDIHGLTRDNAWLSLEQFFQNAKSNNYEKLRIIHGKGNHSQGEAVLKKIVRSFIEQCSFAGESGIENSANGKSGATWVLLK